MSRSVVILTLALTLGLAMVLACSSERTSPTSAPSPEEYTDIVTTNTDGSTDSGRPSNENGTTNIPEETYGGEAEVRDDPVTEETNEDLSAADFTLHLRYEGDLGGTWHTRADRSALLEKALNAVRDRDAILRRDHQNHITDVWAAVEAVYPNIRVWVKARTSHENQAEAWLWKSSPARGSGFVTWSHFTTTEVPLEGGSYLNWDNYAGEREARFVSSKATLSDLGLGSSGGPSRGTGTTPLEGMKATPCELTAIGVSAWHCLWWSIGCGPLCGLGCGLAMGLLWALACD